MRFESEEPTGQDTVLDLRFRPVTMETIRDLAVFRGKYEPFGNCSCMRWRMRSAEFTRITKSDRARAFDALVERRTPVGILAYLEDIPIGWCSIAPKETFVALKGSRTAARRGDARIWSVTCFCVDPRHRREGISVRLLMAAVEYARGEGAKIIEGYPIEPGKDPRASMGSPSTFRRAGFRDVNMPGRKRHIMRNVVG